MRPAVPSKSSWSPLVTTGLESGTRPWKPVAALYGPGAASVEPERWRIDVHRQLLSVLFGPDGWHAEAGCVLLSVSSWLTRYLNVVTGSPLLTVSSAGSLKTATPATLGPE